ncbi:biosynthetic arginine decarboxylase [Thermus thermophilus]|uniref:biosynthetic arginine decarboxylase n=1 Tax=Thermus thermophilus TaxID=274 RepID=UPI001165823F|nr:biosynthetic arginine decarboxylase [Thermus thermophilus]BBL82928.1 biosynthetic arginine decarboxylase [Thermus thermophilus]BBL85227.1 biosynthetic arginine decarboxylase [Thermus thermophilus]BCZ89935.1 biosynthetic arginine decarboxylase [Thermus thermophilus]
MKVAKRFTLKDAEELYLVPHWSGGFFRVGEKGDLEVTPLGPKGPAASLLEIVEALRDEGRPLPLVLRFPQILEARVRDLNEAFLEAMAKYGYQGTYRGVYPVKVNQRRLVLETVARAGRPYHLGLEAGSKPELALILAQDLSEEALITTNGFKDDDFVRLALMGKKLGRNVVITLEKFAELFRVLRLSKELGVKPLLGIRYKLKAKGAGQWEASGGENAKFGLTTPEIVRAVEVLREEGLLDALVMLHAHIGSQVTDIRRIKAAVREAAQTYVQLRKLGAPLRYLNLGGGLAVDYDGSKTNFYASANYTLSEYAENLVYVTKEVVEAQGEPHPILVTESGRAITAYHEVLVLQVIDVIAPPGEARPSPPPPEAHPLVKELWESLQSLSPKNFQEVYHDAFADKETLQTLYDLGLVSLRDRALAEEIFYHIARRVQAIAQNLPYVPDELEDLEKLLADKLVCNFSVFQSLPDAWAIHQLFPVVPLSRLLEPPTRKATLVDISCDSDGKIDRFIDLHDVRQTLPVHPVRPGEPYYLGVFLVGAYQDVLGSNHNLFGQVGEAHVRVEEEGFAIERFVGGETAERVIEKMGFTARELMLGVERLVRRSPLSPAEKGVFLERYARELQGYTYLED